MNATQLIAMLHEQLDSMPMGKEEIDRLQEKFADDPEASADALAAWLSASIFYTLSWEKKHVQEGENDEAEEERDRTIVASKALDLLKPYVSAHPVDSPQGSI